MTFGFREGRATALIVVLLSAGCASWRSAPRGDSLVLGEPVVLEDRDLVWSIAFDPRGDGVAYVHLAADGYRLARWARGPGGWAQRWDVPVSPVEWDAETVELSPKGLVAVVSRDGVLRTFDDATGARQKELATGQPLVSLAFSADGELVAVGSADGRISVFAPPELARVAELQAHQGEVRGLAFAPDGTLYSGGWDRAVQAQVLVASYGERVLEVRRRRQLEGFVNDVSVDPRGATLGVALSASPAQRTLEVYLKEKRGEVEPERDQDCAALVDAASLEVSARLGGHRGVVATAAVGGAPGVLASGGWDRRLRVRDPRQEQPEAREFGGAIRRVRFSAEGSLLAVAAWTPVVLSRGGHSKPAAVLLPVALPR